jgi:hypothetical protein
METSSAILEIALPAVSSDNFPILILGWEVQLFVLLTDLAWRRDWYGEAPAIGACLAKTHKKVRCQRHLHQTNTYINHHND